MEQVYVIKVKELSPKNLPSLSLRSDLLNQTDFSRGSLFGFSLFQLLFAILSIIFSLIGATTDWTFSFGVLLGISHALTALVGVFASERSFFKFTRSRSVMFMSISFSLYSLISSTVFVTLIMFGRICASGRSLSLQLSLITANMMQLTFSSFASLTCARILWPNFASPWIRSWPQKPKIQSKMIIKTTIYSNGVNKDQFSRSLGPNCVVSLVQSEDQVQSSEEKSERDTKTDHYDKENKIQTLNQPN